MKKDEQKTKTDPEPRKRILSSNEFQGKNVSPDELPQATIPAEKTAQRASAGAGQDAVRAALPSLLAPLTGLPMSGAFVSYRVGSGEMRTHQQVSLAPGVYIWSGTTRGGKSVTGLGLTLALNSFSENKPKVLATYHSVYEPGSPAYSHAGLAGSSKIDEYTTASVGPFSNPELYMNEFSAALSIIRKAAPDVRVVVVSDSLSAAVKSYQLDKRAGMGTFEKGIQPLDRQFLVDLSQICTRSNVTMFAVVNPDLLPVGPWMEAVTEGYVNVISPGLFTKRERSSGRADVTIQLEERFVREARLGLGYPAADMLQNSDGAQVVLNPFNRP